MGKVIKKWFNRQINGIKFVSEDGTFIAMNCSVRKMAEIGIKQGVFIKVRKHVYTLNPNNK